MKTISEQLKDLGLKHGDLCEIEGVEGRLIVRQNFRDLSAETDKEIYRHDDSSYKVTCGWKVGNSHITAMLGDLAIYYTKVLPKTSPKPLPEAVEDALQAKWNKYKEVWRQADSVNFERTCEYAKEAILAERDFARAILAEAAKPKGTIADIIGANPVYGPKKT